MKIRAFGWMCSSEWRYSSTTNELYNLKSDPGEEVNLYKNSEFKAIINELSIGMEEWFEQYTDPRFDGSKEKVTGSGQITSHLFK